MTINLTIPLSAPAADPVMPIFSLPLPTGAAIGHLSIPSFESGNLVNGDFIGDAAQGTALRDRSQSVDSEQRGRLRMRDHGPGRQDRTRIRESLNAGGDVHCGPEVVLAVIEHDRQARPFVDADLEQQVRPSISRILASVRW